MPDQMNAALLAISPDGMADPATKRLMELAYAAGLGAKAALATKPGKPTPDDAKYRPRGSDRKMRHLLDAMKVVIGISGTTIPTAPRAAYLLLRKREGWDARGSAWFLADHAYGPHGWREKPLEEVSTDAVVELKANGMLAEVDGDSTRLVPTLSCRDLLSQGWASPTSTGPWFGAGHMTLACLGEGTDWLQACLDGTLVGAFLRSNGSDFPRYEIDGLPVNFTAARMLKSGGLILFHDECVEEQDEGCSVAVGRYLATEKCRLLTQRGWADDRDDANTTCPPDGLAPLAAEDVDRMRALLEENSRGKRERRKIIYARSAHPAAR